MGIIAILRYGTTQKAQLPQWTPQGVSVTRGHVLIPPNERSPMTIKRYDSNKVYSKAVEANGFIYTAGIVPADLSKNVTGQTADVLAEIDRLLALAGSSKAKVISASIWLNDIRHRDAMNEAWIAWVGGEANAPTRACVEAKLVDPKMLVEIAVVAVK